jgi:lysozyme
MLQGIDVYAGSGEVDWARIKAAGISFCFIRAAYGDRADDAALDHLRGARSAGLTCGVYHFLRASKDAKTQIALMESQVRDLGIGAGDLPPVVDVEDNPGHDGPWKDTDNPRYLELLSQWTAAMQALVGAPPIIYTRAGFWKQLGNPAGFKANPLWVASYRADHPQLPESWPDYAFWQHTESASLKGLKGTFDLSYFRSDAPDALLSMALK